MKHGRGIGSCSVLRTGLGLSGVLAAGLAFCGSAAAQEAQIVLSGTVVGHIGASIPSAEIVFVRSDTAERVTQTTSDASGNYVALLPPAVYDIEVYPPVGDYAARVVTAQALQSDRALDIALQPSAVHVYESTLVDLDGNPFVGAEPGCYYWPEVIEADSVERYPKTWRLTASANSPARAVLAPARYNVEHDLSCSASGSGTLHVSSLEPLRLSSDLSETVVVPTLPATYVVRDATGAPVVGARVHFELRAEVDGWLLYNDTDRLTDSTGSVALDLIDGQGMITVHPPENSGLLVKRIPITEVPSTLAEITLATPVTLRVQLLDSDGHAPPLSPCLTSSVGLRSAVDETASGSAQNRAFNVAPGSYQASLGFTNNCNGNPMGDPLLPSTFSGTLQSAFEISGPESRVVSVPTTAIEGRLTDATGNPLAEVIVSAFVKGHPEGWLDAQASETVTTDQDGRYVLHLPPGQGTLIVSDDGFAIDTAVPESFNIVTMPKAEFAIGVGAWLEAEEACPNSILDVNLVGSASNPWLQYSATTLGNGVATGSAQAGDYDVFLRFIDGCNHANWSGGWRSPLTVPTASPTELPFERVLLSGVVQDGDGRPLPGIVVEAEIDADTAGWDLSMNTRVTTDASGAFQLLTAPGSGVLNIDPSNVTNFVGTAVPITIAGDKSVIAVLEFKPELASATLAASATLTTDSEGDGATARDPLETEVVVASGGEVRIVESPITVVAPQGYQLLTQQVNISAPEGSASDPLTLRFSLDATRMDSDMALDDLVIFQDGDPVAECGATEPLSPDPCVSERTLLGDDVRLTVLTSHASTWTIGRALMSVVPPEEPGGPEPGHGHHGHGHGGHGHGGHGHGGHGRSRGHVHGDSHGHGHSGNAHGAQPHGHGPIGHGPAPRPGPHAHGRAHGHG